MADAQETYREVLRQHARFRALASIHGLLWWDMETFLPKNSHEIRGEQLSVMSGLMHREETRPETIERIFSIDPTKLATDADRKQLKRLRKSTARTLAMDEAFVERQSRLQVQTQNSWKEARETKDFAKVAPYLTELVGLQREWAQRLRESPHLKADYRDRTAYEIHLDLYEPGMKSSMLHKLFEPLGKGLRERLPRILARQESSADFGDALRMGIPKQKVLLDELLARCGFDFTEGRLDISVHPFCSGVPGDVRMTTRFREEDLTDAFYSGLHETGHGIYEQNLPKEFRNTPCGEAASMGVHESQSRFLENQIGRSRPFVEYLADWLKLDAPSLHSALNHVQASYIRVDADEVTYNLHILMRMELEENLIEGRLEVKDLPEAWNGAFEKSFALKVTDPAKGCLQDIHWYGGGFGYFPTYTLGNLLAAELFADFSTENPDWATRIRKGDLHFVKEFMNDRVHRLAAFEDGPTTMRLALKGRDPGHAALLAYIDHKYLT